MNSLNKAKEIIYLGEKIEKSNNDNEPLVLSNGSFWSSRKEAAAYFKGLLNFYRDEEVIVCRRHHGELLALLMYYDDAIAGGRKIGVGVSCFFRRRNRGSGYSSPSFWISRVDGTETDFSYIRAVDGREKNDAKRFYNACRAEVYRSLVKVKRQFFLLNGDSGGAALCPMTGKLMAFETSHVIYNFKTFGEIVTEFKVTQGWEMGFPEGILTLPGDSQTQYRFIDRKVARLFRRKHTEVANLMIVHRQTMI